MTAKIGAILFGVISIMTILVAFGAPIGEFTMGGQHKILPKSFRIMAFISFIIQVFAIIIILQAGGIIPPFFSSNVTKYICIFFAVYLTLNTVMNFTSNSIKEKFIMTPLALITAICFWVTSLNK